MLYPIVIAVCVGLVVSALCERLLAPKAPHCIRHFSTWLIHIGLWLGSFGSVLLLTQRPFFAAVAVNAFLLLVVLIGNAKYASLREVFTVQDFRYIGDALRFPRLYLPFLGLFKGLAIVTLVGSAVVWAILLESAAVDTGTLVLVAALLLGIGLSLVLVGSRTPLPLQFDPAADLLRYGLLSSLYLYWQAKRRYPSTTSPFAGLPRHDPIGCQKPHLIAVQSESFFDPRPLNPNIRPTVLSEFDALKADAMLHGDLEVPAWGANTVRTEFSFLTGLEGHNLGAHQFNPYEAIVRGWKTESIASHLRRQGYRTVCIHPFMARFYQRNRVFPLLGFDEFIDISDFEGAERFGPYVSDQSVTKKILEVIKKNQGQAIFIFVITMENHGPLHLERITAAEAMHYFLKAPQPNWLDMSIYLRHLANADRMIGTLKKAFENSQHPTSLCWFGDHVPIMKEVYRELEQVPKETCYAVWQNFESRYEKPVTKKIPISTLGSIWLELSFSPRRPERADHKS
jgi:hypothetical protein